MRLRLPRLRLAIYLLMLVAAMLVIAVLLTLSARSKLNQGLAEIRRAEVNIQAHGASAHPLTAIDAARSHVVAARSNFSSASDRLGPLAPLLRHVGWLPGIGAEAAASPDAARMAAQTTDGAIALLDGVRPVAVKFSEGRVTKRIPVGLLMQALFSRRKDFSRACVSFRSAQKTRSSLQGDNSSRVRALLKTFDRRLPQLLGLCHALPLVPTLFGYPRPRNYLLAYQNSDELRATGGFIGSFSLLTLDKGSVRTHFRSSGLRDNLSIPPPEPVQLYNREPGWLLRDSNWSPDFPTSAALERFFAALDLHTKVQGVVNITAQAVADLLRVTGPVYLPEYHRSVTPGNIAALADYYTHRTTTPGPRQYADKETGRKQFIGIVANHLVSLLQSLPPARILSLGSATSSAIASRDLLLSLPAPPEEALVRSLGASGRVDPESADYLYVVHTNLSYNKINPYVRFRDSYNARIEPDRWLHASLTLQMQNVPAPPVVATYGEGPGAGRLGRPDDYADFVRIYVPPGALLISQSGWTQPWTAGPAYGKTMFCGYVIVRSGETRTIKLKYIVPPNVFSWSGGRRYRLLVQHQPGSHPVVWTIAISDGSKQLGSFRVPHPTSDWARNLPVGVRPFHPLRLPREIPVVVKPGHLIEPHAYLAVPK